MSKVAERPAQARLPQAANESEAPPHRLARAQTMPGRAPLTRPWLAGFGAFSLLISGLFFAQAISSNWDDLSGDQVNILTLCVQRDFPGSLKDDLIVGDPSDTSYYIPAFVRAVRVLSLPDHNYIRGLSIMLLAISLVYMWGWFLLFSLWGNPWVAAGFAFLVRGILWPPGNEFWGVAGLWTVMPRTVFLALIPWLVWLWLSRGRRLYAGMATFLGLGLLINLHPVSGLAVTSGLLAAQVYLRRRRAAQSREAGPPFIVCLGLVLAGLIPSAITYFTVKSAAAVDRDELLQAMHERLRDVFFDPSAYWKEWLKPNWLAFVIIPALLCWVMFRHFTSEEKERVTAFALMAAAAVCVTIIPLALTAIVERMGWRPPFTYDLVRAGKYVIFPCMLAISLSLACLLRMLPIAAGPIFAGAILALSLIAGRSAFNHVPILNDDMLRSLWPMPVGTAPFKGDRTLDGAIGWIRDNTSDEARFVGPRLIRVAAHRAVIHELAGAGMLVAGNPQKFAQTYEREMRMREMLEEDPSSIPGLLATWGADYWVVKKPVPGLQPAYSSSGWNIYYVKDAK